jgi:hypothetical protein
MDRLPRLIKPPNRVLTNPMTWVLATGSVSKDVAGWRSEWFDRVGAAPFPLHQDIGGLLCCGFGTRP